MSQALPAPADPATLSVATPSRPADAGRGNRGGGGVKETIESILVAFILAFVFRAFVVEAFVIPTGSMATTLLGAHTRYHCPDCGYGFDVNYSSVTTGEDEDVNVPATAGLITTPIYCPNCGFRVPPEQVANPPIAYGDRILVLKYLYLLGPPKRWDVVVFKAPEKPNQNYIKRLTGLPGEAVMILDGDVYTRAPGDPDPKHFTVQPKPPGAQAAMWRLVYDNDYHPAGEPRSEYPWQQPWHVSYGTGCRQDDAATHGRVFTFDARPPRRSSPSTRWPTRPQQGFTDYLVANQNTHQPARDPETRQIVEGPLEFSQRYPDPMWVNPSDIPVSDLDLRLTYQRTAGAGPFAASMTKRGHTFTAELTPTTATLYQDSTATGRTVGRPFSLPSGHGPVRVELSNADYRATLRINDEIVAQTTPEGVPPEPGRPAAGVPDGGPAPAPGRRPPGRRPAEPRLAPEPVAGRVLLQPRPRRHLGHAPRLPQPGAAVGPRRVLHHGRQQPAELGRPLLDRADQPPRRGSPGRPRPRAGAVPARQGVLRLLAGRVQSGRLVAFVRAQLPGHADDPLTAPRGRRAGPPRSRRYRTTPPSPPLARSSAR